MSIHVNVRRADDVIIVDLEGRLVSSVADEILHNVMNELVAEGWKKILLNLSKVSAIDSSGVGELVAGMKLAKRFGSGVKILRLGDRVKHVLTLSQILPLLQVYENEKEALDDFAKPGGDVGSESGSGKSGG